MCITGMINHIFMVSVHIPRFCNNYWSTGKISISCTHKINISFHVFINRANLEKGNISCMNLECFNQDYLQLNYKKTGWIHVRQDSPLVSKMQPRILYLAKNWFLCASYMYLCMSRTWSLNKFSMTSFTKFYAHVATL